MSKQNNIRNILNGHSIIPVVTFTENDNPIAFMDYLIQNGIRCIEVTLRTPQGMEAIQRLKDEMGDDILVGAGTVISPGQIMQLKRLKADFIVSPGLTRDLQILMDESSLPYLPGVATPSEIIKAMELGLTTLKFFPANLFGGLSALKTYANLFPDIQFCPTGGVNKESSQEFLVLNNVFAVGGSWLQNEFDTYLKEK